MDLPGWDEKLTMNQNYARMGIVGDSNAMVDKLTGRGPSLNKGDGEKPDAFVGYMTKSTRRVLLLSIGFSFSFLRPLRSPFSGCICWLLHPCF